MPPPLDIEASARRAGGHRWVEERLFEMLGSWSAELPDDEAAALVGTHSRQHGAHAELWRSCLPTLPQLDPDAVTVAPSAAVAAVVDAVAAGRPPVDGSDDADDGEAEDGEVDDPTLERLVGVYRVLLPRLLVAYGRRRAEASPVCDGPVVRVLDLVLAAEVPAWQAGEALVQRLLVGPEDARRAAQCQSRLETSLVAAGGIP